MTEDYLAATASLNVEYLERADGDELRARATTIPAGRKLMSPVGAG